MEFERTASRSIHLNVTSLVDVLFLLLIFFMLTSHFLNVESMAVQFPDATSSSTGDAQPLVVVVASEGRLLVNNQPTSLTDLASLIEAPLKEAPERRVMVMSTNQVDVQELIQVMDAVQHLGGKNVSVSHWEY